MVQPSHPSFLKSTGILIKSRLEPIFVWSWPTAVACMIAGKGFPPLLPSLKAIVSMIFITISVYIYNDIIDCEIDKLNSVKKNRPLPTGKVPIEVARKLVYISGIIGLFIMLSINIHSFIFGLIFYILYIIYSNPKIHLKKKFLFKESIITSGLFLTSLVAMYAVANSFSPKAFFASILFGIIGFTGQPAFNDTSDIEADKIQGVKSLAIVLSWRRKMQLSILGVLVIMTLTPLTYVRFGYNMILPIYAVAGSLIILRYLFPIVNKFDLIVTLKTSKFIKIYYIFLQIFAIIGAVNLKFIF